MEIIMSLIILYSGVINSEAANTEQAFYLGACTVKNRIDSGWSPYKVMDHYYAPYSEPTKEQIDIMNNVINGDASCPDVYFMYSDDDVEYLFRIWEGDTICDDTQCNVFMTKKQFREAT